MRGTLGVKKIQDFLCILSTTKTFVCQKILLQGALQVLLPCSTSVFHNLTFPVSRNFPQLHNCSDFSHIVASRHTGSGKSINLRKLLMRRACLRLSGPSISKEMLFCKSAFIVRQSELQSVLSVLSVLLIEIVKLSEVS